MVPEVNPTTTMRPSKATQRRADPDLLRPAGRGDDARPRGPGYLYRRRSHSPGPRVDQNRLAFPQRRPAVESDVGGLVGDVQRGGLLEGHRLRARKDAARCGGRHLLGEAARGERGRGEYSGTRLELYVFPGLDDGSGDFGTGGEGGIRALLVLALAEQDVEEVEGRRLDLDNDLAGVGFGLLDLVELQDVLRVSKLVYPPSAHLGSSSSFGATSLPPAGVLALPVDGC